MAHTFYYHNDALEQDFLRRLRSHAEAPSRHAAPQRQQLSAEMDAIVQSGAAALFALVSSLSHRSLRLGYPISFRGNLGNLLTSYHLLGLTQNDPLTLRLPWQCVFGSTGHLAPHITLNVAHAVYDDLLAHISALLPDCNVVRDAPELPPYRLVLAPGPYDPEGRYLTLDLLSHQLLDQAGDAARHTARTVRPQDIHAPAFLRQVWQEDLEDWPVLRDMAPLLAFSPDLRPGSFAQMTTLLALSLAPHLWNQVQSADADLDSVIATREDVYELCLSWGLEQGEALSVMENLGRGRPNRLTDTQQALLEDHDLGFLFAPDHKLYYRGQCAEYMTYALILRYLQG